MLRPPRSEPPFRPLLLLPPPALRERLLELAIPEKLSAALVEHITGESQGAHDLTEIERAGLFLAQMDLDGTWLRFHNLFRQFLLARAADTWTATALARRHRHIAQWYERNGLVRDAIGHWLDAGSPSRAAKRLSGIVVSLVAQERLGLIERYVDRLGLEAVLRHDDLVHAAVVAYGFRRAFDKAERLLERHRQRLDASKSSADTRDLHQVSRLFVLAARDRIEQLGAEAAATAETLVDRGGSRYGVTLNARAMFEVGRGAFDEARALMVKARPLHDRDHHVLDRRPRTFSCADGFSGGGAEIADRITSPTNDRRGDTRGSGLGATDECLDGHVVANRARSGNHDLVEQCRVQA